MLDVLETTMNEKQAAAYLSSIAKEIVAFFGNVRGYKKINECASDDEVLNLFRRTIRQLIIAVERKDGVQLELKGTIQHVLADNKNASIPDICAQTVNKPDNLSMVKDAILLCKRQGVFPYYAAKFVAAVVHQMKTSGMIKAAEEYIALFGFELEPQLNYLILEEYGALQGGKFFEYNPEKIQKMSVAYEKGFVNEAEYTGCCQSTIKAFFDSIGTMSEEEKYLFKAATGLQGGVGSCTDSACGSYSGCALVISTYVGRAIEDFYAKNPEPGASSDALVQKIRDKFLKAYDAVNCRDLHMKTFGRYFDFSLPEDGEAFDALGGHADKCPSVVGLSSAWVTEVLYDEGLL